jgi:hypothetical protein
MNRIDSWLILSLLVGYTGKLLALGASPADAGVLLVLAAAYSMQRYYSVNKQHNELKQELTDIRSSIKDQDLVITELKTSLAGAKIAGGFRSVK